ncbi:MAG: TIGR03862 family flavoprotein [Spirochaetales bacterium]|nr:TIGR03862 family flavoprotein [Spirochaetales bacterium]
MIKNVVVIGAGPTGLFASSLLLKEGFSVDLYDQKKNAGRKFLLAGKSGLNLTNNRSFDSFVKAYDGRQIQMEPALTHFSPEDLRLWFKKLGVKTFEGSSGGVFPVSIGAKKILTLWMDSLNSHKNFKFHPDHQLIKIEKDNIFLKTGKDIIKVHVPLLIMGMGGASYPGTGSDGRWNKILNDIDIETIPFKPMNCGFECSWSSYFKNYTNHIPIKNVQLTHNNQSIRGDILITPYGIEGRPVYILSREIRNAIEKNQKTTVYLDLTPDLPIKEITKRLNRRQGKNSLSNHLRKQLNFSPIKISILRELTDKNIISDYSLLAYTLKKLPLSLNKTRPIKEAISSSGGVSFHELDNHFMLRKYPGWFTAGEMVDWDAPTGGYLLQGCFSTAYMVVKGIKSL